MAPSSLGKQTANCESPHDWMMSLAMDLSGCVTCRGENGSNGSHFPIFSEDIAFAHHFMATCLPPILPPYMGATGIGYASKKLSKMAGNPASYSVYSRYSELL